MNDGGPAFPTLNGAEIWHREETGNYVVGVDPSGVTLRDYFAAKALQSLIARGYDATGISDYQTAQRAAQRAYQLAHAMLLVRDEQK